jgi:uncharacterized protein (TIGR02466 family)
MRGTAGAASLEFAPMPTRSPIQSLFPTRIYTAQLQQADWRKLNQQLLRECLQLQMDDEAGRRWSKLNYPGGYTSYHSAHRMQQVSPTFATLERRIGRHVNSFVNALELDMSGRELAMTDCWVNIMPRQVAHSMHLHPLSTISGIGGACGSGQSGAVRKLVAA